MHRRSFPVVAMGEYIIFHLISMFTGVISSNNGNCFFCPID